MTPEEYIQRLTEISAKKYKLMEDMLSITKAQSETMNEDGIEELERLVALKQVKINEIDKLDEQFSVYFLRLKQELKVKSLEEINNAGIPGIKELQRGTGNILLLIKEIKKVEAQNNINAKKLLDRFGGEVRKINQSKVVNRAYNEPPAVQAPSYFIDKKK